MATLIATDGTERTVTPKDKARGFTLEEIYALLSDDEATCDIFEISATLPDGRLLLGDEEAKVRTDTPRARNEKATTLLHRAGGIPWDWFSGPALVCDDNEVQ